MVKLRLDFLLLHNIRHHHLTRLDSSTFLGTKIEYFVAVELQVNLQFFRHPSIIDEPLQHNDQVLWECLEVLLNHESSLLLALVAH